MSATSDQQANQYKKRFCATFPNVNKCRHGSRCGYAHSREEIRVPVLSADEERCKPCAMTADFFLNRFKTLWCPIGVKHDWVSCPYAHSYQDSRRPVSIGYGIKPCPHWSKKQTCEEYMQRCPNGLQCPYSHGAKEKLYHPNCFRTGICRDYQGKRCPRGHTCAWFHKSTEQRCGGLDDTNYNMLLPEENIDQSWAREFLALPGFADDEAVLAPPPKYSPDTCIATIGSPPGLSKRIPDPQEMWAPQACESSEPAYLPFPPGLEEFCRGEPAFISLSPELEKFTSCKVADTSTTRSTASSSDGENCHTEDLDSIHAEGVLPMRAFAEGACSHPYSAASMLWGNPVPNQVMHSYDSLSWSHDHYMMAAKSSSATWCAL